MVTPPGPWTISDKPMALSCDLALGCGNLNFTRDTSPHFDLPFSEI